MPRKHVSLPIFGLLVTGCTIDSTRSESFQGGGFTVLEDGTARLSDEVVRIAAICANGQLVVRVDGAWGCAEDVGVAQAELETHKSSADHDER